MTEEKVNLFLMTNGKYFPQEKLMYLKDKLMRADDDKLAIISSVELKSPTTSTILSVFLGEFGVDRFIVGDTGLGVLKLLTAGCFGVMWFVDLFLISKRAKEINFSKIMMLL